MILNSIVLCYHRKCYKWMYVNIHTYFFSSEGFCVRRRSKLSKTVSGGCETSQNKWMCVNILNVRIHREVKYSTVSDNKQGTVYKHSNDISSSHPLVWIPLLLGLHNVQFESAHREMMRTNRVCSWYVKCVCWYFCLGDNNTNIAFDTGFRG